jgi:hypothetical protein
MDLILITLEPLDILGSTDSAPTAAPGASKSLNHEKLKAQQQNATLGLVVSSTANTDKSTGPRINQVNVIARKWDLLRQSFNDAHINVFAPSGRSIPGRGSAGPAQSNTQQSKV